MMELENEYRQIQCQYTENGFFGLNRKSETTTKNKDFRFLGG